MAGYFDSNMEEGSHNQTNYDMQMGYADATANVDQPMNMTSSSQISFETQHAYADQGYLPATGVLSGHGPLLSQHTDTVQDFGIAHLSSCPGNTPANCFRHK
jgi:hypothetical protein